MTIPSRRQFLKTAAASSALCLGLGAPFLLRSASLAATRGPALASLPTIDATNSSEFQLSAMANETQFVAGVPSQTMGFNLPYLGPIVRVRPGTNVSARVENRTEVPISVHWHGLLVPSDTDGGPHQPIAPGEIWKPVLAIEQPPATLWYHTHIHGETAPRVYAGLAGVLIVDDGKDKERGLPATEGVDDLVLVLQDKRFNASGEAVYEPGSADLMHGFLGDVIIVNGQVAPIASVPAGIVRLRLLNAANARTFDLSFADGRSIALIATDQGFLPRSVAVSHLRLAPGERAEVLVDFGGGGAATLVSQPQAETSGMMPMAGMMHSAVPLPETFTSPFPVLEFEVDAAFPAAIKSAPTAFDAADQSISPPVATRGFVLNDMGMMMGGGMMGGGMRPRTQGPGMTIGINGQPFDMSRLDLEVGLGTTERWIVAGQMMGHPFHVHGARFLVARENGGFPRPENTGWKDTVFVEGETELLVRFDHGAKAGRPFMIHCHILEHEDAGMMAQFSVT